MPRAIREHLVERFRERGGESAAERAELQAWIALYPDVPEGEWFKRFGDFTICGEGRFPKTFLKSRHRAYGEEL